MTGSGRFAVVVADWSGAADPAVQRRRIVVAEARGGRIVDVTSGRTRAATVDALCARVARAVADDERLVIGLDFAFSFPAWFCREIGATDVTDVWRTVACRADEWLAGTPPFWGRRTKRPDFGDRPQLRECDRRVGARSVFQIGGAGSVGTASLRGMPALAQLRAAGASVWPFDPPGRVQVCEVWPRLSIGSVRKSDAAARREWLTAHLDTADAGWSETAASSDDAFDAVAAAWDCSRRGRLVAPLARATDPTTLIEGSVLDPTRVDHDGG